MGPPTCLRKLADSRGSDTALLVSNACVLELAPVVATALSSAEAISLEFSPSMVDEGSALDVLFLVPYSTRTCIEAQLIATAIALAGCV
jgi:hypothetical protein